MNGYSTQDVAGLLGIPAERIRNYARAGFIMPARGSHNEYIYSFQDLVLLRTAAELERQDVPPRRISAALSRLKTQLPTDRALSEVRIHIAGDEIVVTESGEPPWNPRSGQFHMEFDARELATAVAPLARAEEDEPPADSDAGERTAGEWFEQGLELESSAPDQARSAYEHALALEPELSEARVNLGRLLHEEGRLSEAEAHYRAVLSQREHALAAYNLGVVLEDLGRAGEAIRAYARAIAAQPDLAEAHYNLARLYEARGDSRAAIRYFNGYRELVRSR